MYKKKSHFDKKFFRFFKVSLRSFLAFSFKSIAQCSEFLRTEKRPTDDVDLK